MLFLEPDILPLFNLGWYYLWWLQRSVAAMLLFQKQTYNVIWFELALQKFSLSAFQIVNRSKCIICLNIATAKKAVGKRFLTASSRPVLFCKRYRAVVNKIFIMFRHYKAKYCQFFAYNIMTKTITPISKQTDPLIRTVTAVKAACPCAMWSKPSHINQLRYAVFCVLNKLII